MKVFRKLVVRLFLAVFAGSCLLAAPATPPAYSQAKSDQAQKIPETRGMLPIEKFYDTPSPLVPKKPGDLIRSEEFDEYTLPPDVLAIRILYYSRSAGGQNVAVSGVVLYPDKKAPAGGWPVIAWAHAMNGVARQCAPSLARNVQHGPFLSMYVSLGYAVVATDYAGLGTSFRNAFSDMFSNATDVIYSVPAARAVLPALGPRWVAIGVGEGGTAVVGVAELEHQLQDSNYLGSIAISGLDDLKDRYQPSGADKYPRMPLFLAYGIKTVYPEFDVKDLLTDKAFALYTHVDQGCTEPSGESSLSPRDLLKPNWEANKFVTQYFKRNTPGQSPAQSPILVISSELDPAVPIQRTVQVVAHMCRLGDRVQFARYPQSDQGSVFGDSVGDQMSWIQGRFAGRAPVSNCADLR